MRMALLQEPPRMPREQLQQELQRDHQEQEQREPQTDHQEQEPLQELQRGHREQEQEPLQELQKDHQKRERELQTNCCRSTECQTNHHPRGLQEICQTCCHPALAPVCQRVPHSRPALVQWRREAWKEASSP